MRENQLGFLLTKNVHDEEKEWEENNNLNKHVTSSS